MIIILINLYVYNFFWFMPVINILFIIWKIFFKQLYQTINKKNSWDIFKREKININGDCTYIYYIFIYYFLIYILFLSIMCININSFFWLNFKCSNFSYHLILILIVVMYYFNYIIYKIIIFCKKINPEFLLVCCSINITISTIYICNNLFSFYFIIELIVLLIFFQFINNKNNFQKNFSINNLFSIFSKNYLNLVFFNYWVSFFSSIFLLYSSILITMLTGLIDFFLLNFIFNNIIQFNYIINTNIIYFLLFVFFLAFILKLGISPLQLYKIEIYKSISILNILYYTIIYFFYFLFFLIIFYTYILSSVYKFTSAIISIFVVISTVYLIVFIYDINIFKVFLSYSTIINSILFILTLNSAIN